MFNTQMLADMRQQNIKEVNADDLVDIRTVSVDTSLPPEQRMMNYLEQVKNPYLFRVGMPLYLFGFPLAEPPLTAC